jgi:hypothetical protein
MKSSYFAAWLYGVNGDGRASKSAHLTEHLRKSPKPGSFAGNVLENEGETHMSHCQLDMASGSRASRFQAVAN